MCRHPVEKKPVEKKEKLLNRPFNLSSRISRPTQPTPAPRSANNPTTSTTPLGTPGPSRKTSKELSAEDYYNIFKGKIRPEEALVENENNNSDTANRDPVCERDVSVGDLSAADITDVDIEDLLEGDEDLAKAFNEDEMERKSIAGGIAERYEIGSAS